MKSLKGNLPKFGAIWMLIYPNIMIEWYPETLVISTVHPLSPEKTLNITEFYYSEDVALFETEFIKNQQKAYSETVLEDDEIAIKIDRGRKILSHNEREESGPYHELLEAGIPHFYKYLSHSCNGLYYKNTES
jgi:phenylpropionate dioxygenase-like ring-hydroxylating dioxygenase large terminal subunit